MPTGAELTTLQDRPGTRARRRPKFAWLLAAAPALLGFAVASALPAHAKEQPEAPRNAASAPAPVAIDAQLTTEGAVTRLAFTVSAPLTAQIRVLEKPDRLVLDLPEVNFQVPPDLGRKGRGLVKSFRYGLIAPGRSRVVIELAGPALPSRVASEPVLGGAAHTFTVDLKRSDREAYAKAAVSEIPDVKAPGHPVAAMDGKPVIVLDPGHGGIDTGAIGVAQTIEKDVVYAFARTLRDKLEKTGRYRVVMTRDADSFVSLGERVRIAQNHNASLFVSIHADTIAVSPEVRGLTVYTNADRASDAESARLAEIENRADMVAGLDPNEDPEEVAGILSDLTRRETRTYSHLFAKTLVGQITATSKLNKNPHRSAGFRVLRAPDVPSVLIELGYLSSKSDVQLLTAADWRDRATDSIAQSIGAFLAPRLAGQGVTIQ